ncbi:hypothetical protein F8M41_009997 [Gigaspora margarita]|uniref:Uncharacterized protein n=1 Tax=Gigaspora margarita TaxID=4874 RepID=A0A8H4A1B8_GIGMA|nr:hypothetical protein F8M41_009997 [Gigaspora margarita]
MTNSDDADVLESTFSFEERDLILTDDEANNDKASNKPDNEPEEEEFGEEPGEELDDESEALTDEEFEQTDDRFMNIMFDQQQNIFTNSTKRSLVDVVEEGQINNEILEEESAEFKGFDGEYGPKIC